MGQPARSEENFIINLKSSTEMALGGSRPRRSPYWNPLPIDLVEDELARDSSSVGSLHLGSTSSCNPSPGPDLVLALIPVPVPAPTLPPVTTNKLFTKFMKAYLETNQGLRQLPAEREQTFKAKVLEVYYGKSHMDCYHFCQ